MTSVTSRNSSGFYRYFQFCCNDLQKRTAITFSHPKVLQELRERRAAETLNYGGGGRSVRRRPRAEGKEEGPSPGLYLHKAPSPLGENLGKVLLPFFSLMPSGRSDTLV